MKVFLSSLIFASVLFSGCASSGNNNKAFAPSPDAIDPVKVGEMAPDAQLKTLKGESTSLKSLRGSKPALVVFYRGGWCPYCNTQLQALRKVIPQAKKLGYEVVAISPDKPENLAKTSKKYKLTYKLVSDSKLDLARSFGLAFKVDDKTITLYKQYGIDLIKASGEKHQALPVPAVYVINKKGTVKFNYFNPDYKVRLETKSVIKALKSSL